MFAQEKVTKEKGTPTSGSGLRPDFPPSGAAPGAVTMGRPCPIVPRSASCLASPCATPPLGLLTGTRAPRCLVVRRGTSRLCRRGLGRDTGSTAVAMVAAKADGRPTPPTSSKSGWGGSSGFFVGAALAAMKPTPQLPAIAAEAECRPADPTNTKKHESALELSGNAKRPFRRVSEIVVEGVERHGCRERRDGPRMALRGVPLERRWSERTRSEAQGRMQGQAFLVTFSVTGKSDPPSRAEQMHQQTRKRAAARKPRSRPTAYKAPLAPPSPTPLPP